MRKARPCDPITSRADIERMRERLRQNMNNGRRNAMLVTLGCNLGLRASDLCRLRFIDLKGDYLDIHEKKTGKRRLIAINERVAREVERYQKETMMFDDEYLFYSQKGGHIGPKEIYRIIKTAAQELHIRGNIGSHSLRKTMAYHALKACNGDPEALETVMMMFGHSSIKVTERYLKNSADVDNVYRELNL